MICPLLALANAPHVHCIKERCAWWGGLSCSVATIAEEMQGCEVAAAIDRLTKVVEKS